MLGTTRLPSKAGSTWTWHFVTIFPSAFDATHLYSAVWSLLALWMVRRHVERVSLRVISCRQRKLAPISHSLGMSLGLIHKHSICTVCALTRDKLLGELLTIRPYLRPLTVLIPDRQSPCGNGQDLLKMFDSQLCAVTKELGQTRADVVPLLCELWHSNHMECEWI